MKRKLSKDTQLPTWFKFLDWMIVYNSILIHIIIMDQLTISGLLKCAL